MNARDKVEGRSIDQTDDNASNSAIELGELRGSELDLRESEEKYRTLFSCISEAVLIFGAETLQFTEVNDAAVHLYGWTRDEFLNLSPFDISTDVESSVSSYAETRAYGVSKSHRVHKKKDGTLFDVEISRSSFSMRGREYFCAVVRDVTQARQAENSLRESEERYRELYSVMRLMCDNVPDMIWAKDMQRRFIFANRAVTEGLLIAHDTEEPLGKTDMFFVQRERHSHPNDDSWHTFGEICVNSDEVVHGSRKPQRFDEFGNVKGEFLYLDVYKSPIWNEEGEMIGTVGCGRNVTNERKVQESLKESETRYRELFNHALDMIYTHDLTGAYTSVNEIVTTLLGYSREEFLTLNYRDIVDPQYLETVENNFLAKVRKGVKSTGPYEVLARTKEGLPVWLEIKSRIIQKSGKPSGVHGIARNVTERKMMETAIREAQAKYQTVVESFDGLIYTSSLDNEIKFANQRLIDWVGHDPVGMKCSEVFQCPDKLYAHCNGENQFGVEMLTWEFLNPLDNHWYHVVQSPILHNDGTRSQLRLMQDVTERKRADEEKTLLREQLFQAQKMEAIGNLSAGIAHDFNNLLQVISGYSELLLKEPGIKHKNAEALSRISTASKSGAELARGLLALGGKIDSQPRPINLNGRITQVRKLLSRTIPKTITVELRLSEELPQIYADPVQIEQILMNLAVNARDAMPKGGKIIFETRSVKLEGAHYILHAELDPGAYVLLQVTDTGSGMDQEIVKRIFEPFFTTKGPGVGTGLGLSIVYGILKQHGGDIRCNSKLGSGTTFDIFLPAVDEKEKLPIKTSDTLPMGGSETIMIVDDDEAILSLLESVFSEMGYTVVPVSNGKEALSKYVKEGKDISLVILDLIMPKMDGLHCLDEILSFDPTANVMIASGYHEQDVRKKSVETKVRAWINKPYDVTHLLKTVRSVLDRT